MNSFEGPPISAAVNYAKTLHSDLLKEFDDSTRNTISKIISDGIQNKTGLPGISRNIRKEFPAISKVLSDKVALTETSWSLSHASLDRMRAMGTKGKQWFLHGTETCEMCRANHNVGVIPTEQYFPSGHLVPPAHDGCTCAIAPALLKTLE